MEPSIYSYSLCIALPLMLFFGFYFLLAQTPEKAIFENYLRSRRIMGMALLLLAANYSVHFFFGIRFKNVHAAILMNLSTYFLCYYLFSSALITLLDRFYITRKRIRTHIILWIIFSGLSGVVLLLFPDGIVQKSTLLALAAWLVVYGLVLSRRVIVAYRRAVRIFDDTHADDIGAYIKWLSIFTYWALIFGVGCGLLTFLPDEYVYIWILSSIPFYVYLYHCYQNYLLFYEQVENAMEDGMTSEEEDPCDTKLEQIQKLENPSYRSEMAEKINGWIDAEGYIQSGLTIKKLADMLQTNRTYLSEYIKTTYGASFRDWITGLRINYAKRLLAQYPRLTVADISERSGFLSPSHFIRLFKENSGCTPVKWRKTEAE
ncbi:helix-turn-helix domain-containing protein [Bacteroides sp.]|uniref:AraC family transcriptional regulator n=1 Tax=Bacteroides sp. TaxID=29523 RepID=UPI003AB688A6